MKETRPYVVKSAHARKRSPGLVVRLPSNGRTTSPTRPRTYCALFSIRRPCTGGSGSTRRTPRTSARSDSVKVERRDPVTGGLQVAKAVETAKRIFDYFKARTKNAEETQRFLDLQESFQTLREDNARLREELGRRGNLRNYRRKQIGGAVVLVCTESDGTDSPPCCPKCRDEDGEPLPLQELAPDFSDFGSHHCTSCKGKFNLS